MVPLGTLACRQAGLVGRDGN